MSAIVDEVSCNGIALTSCDEVLPGLWPIFKEAMESFVAQPDTQTMIKAYQDDPSMEGNKRFLARLLPQDTTDKITYQSDDPWILNASPLLDIAREYFDARPILNYYDLWYTIPLPYERARVASQNWHQDNEAFGLKRRVFKAFLYLSDVEETEDGPFEMQPPEGDSIPAIGKAGTMFFADTGGFMHRGGYCTARPRLLCVWVFNNHERIRSGPRYQAAPGLIEQLGDGVDLLYTYDDWEREAEWRQELIRRGAPIVGGGRYDNERS